MKRYYEAYDDRYREVHRRNLKWFSDAPSDIVSQTMEKYGIDKSARILELGCGEGRDAINLLRAGFNVCATDVSPVAIEHCREWYPDFSASFHVLDCLDNCLDERFAFIYAVSVLHMLVLDEDRRCFYEFIRNHLEDNGTALICTMGDGAEESQSDIHTAFDLQKRTHETTGETLLVVGTSCRKVSFSTLHKEIFGAGLSLLESGMTAIVPDFPVCMYAVVSI